MLWSNFSNNYILKITQNILKCFFQQYIKGNDVFEKRVKNNYNFVNIKAKGKSYYQANKDKIEKKLSEYYSILYIIIIFYYVLLISFYYYLVKAFFIMVTNGINMWQIKKKRRHEKSLLERQKFPEFILLLH